MPVKKHHSTKHLKKPAVQTVLEFREPPMPAGAGSGQVAPYELKLEPIVDKRTYDSFLKTIAMRVYAEFEHVLQSEGMTRPELSLVGFDLKKAETPAQMRMSDYVALNARLILEKAFVDLPGYVRAYMPRVCREMEAAGGDTGELNNFIESRIQRDLTMEIRSIAMIHIPESESFRYISKLKEF